MGKQPGKRRVYQGIINQDRGSMNFKGPVTVNVGTAQAPQTSGGGPGGGTPSGWDLGVITVLPEEAHAITRLLMASTGYRRRELDDGMCFEEAVLGDGTRPVRTVAIRTLDRGQLSAASAFRELRDQCAPRVTAMTGIAGGIHPAVRLGDVVVVLDVVEYEAQKMTPSGTRRRGTSWQVPTEVRRRVGNFFSDHGEPCPMSTVGPDGTLRSFAIHAGIIGSGSTVLAAPDSDIQAYLTAFNDKVLAVETENAGVARAFYEGAATTPGCGWVGVRGICDHADAAKDDLFHEIASWHAAVALQQLSPYLVPGA